MVIRIIFLLKYSTHAGVSLHLMNNGVRVALIHINNETLTYSLIDKG